MGTAQDGYGYVWHYFMQEKSKSWSPAENSITTESMDYWNGLLNTIPATIQDYAVTINCGEADSAVSGLTLNKACTNATTTINTLQERMAAAVKNSNTATLRACT